MQRPGGDAAVVRVHGSKKALAITTDCTPRYCYADPYEGGKQAVAEAYRNLCAVGAKPLAMTNCLNFGNPQRPEIMAQFVGCLDGMGEACRALDFPIVSGNVCLYNESKATGGGSAILPTPAIGGVGLLDDWEKSATIAFKAEGEHSSSSATVTAMSGSRSGSKSATTGVRVTPPPVDLAAEKRAGECIRDLIKQGLVTAVHDCSDGGAAVAVAEMAMAGNIGMTMTVGRTSPKSRRDLIWRGSGPLRRHHAGFRSRARNRQRSEAVRRPDRSHGRRRVGIRSGRPRRRSIDHPRRSPRRL